LDGHTIAKFEVVFEHFVKANDILRGTIPKYSECSSSMRLRKALTNRVLPDANALDEIIAFLNQEKKE